MDGVLIEIIGKEFDRTLYKVEEVEMEIEIYQIDAFADEIFKGNPAAVCPLENWIDEKLMKNIAIENNLSETAFFVKNGNIYEIRWFTPEYEIDLCGHATLASAFVIFNFLGEEKNEIEFSSQSGILKVKKEADTLWLDFPARAPEKCSIDEILLSGIGKRPLEILKARDYFLLYEDESDIKNIAPDFEKLAKVDAVGVIVTAKSEKYDFVCRYFAPGAGVPEDPVTGSAYCTLIPYWSKFLGKDKMKAYQLSARGGEVMCENRGERVLIGGRAKLYMKGKIFV